VDVYEEVDIIQSGRIEVRGVKASAIAWHRHLEFPVLGKYVFVPSVEPPSWTCIHHYECAYI
jgi:hypothetical protein